MSGNPPAKKPSIVLTVGSKVSVRSAGSREEVLVSGGTFRGLVSIGGDSSIAIELETAQKSEKGRVRLIPINALLSLDVVEAVKPEEEKRTEPAATGYFR
ncbi:MAG TPA: hypothetical protein VGV64_06375 [Thermoplasmata archaeon]|nr:hypothetical protein [Thermoplasmata archaeon]